MRSHRVFLVGSVATVVAATSCSSILGINGSFMEGTGGGGGSGSASTATAVGGAMGQSGASTTVAATTTAATSSTGGIGAGAGTGGNGGASSSSTGSGAAGQAGPSTSSNSGATTSSTSSTSSGSGTGPMIMSTTPADGAQPPPTTTISVTFSLPMNSTTLTGQTTAGACAGSIQVSLDGFATCIAFSPHWTEASATVTFTPEPSLLANTSYKILVTTEAESVSGFALAAAFTDGFTTNCDGSVVISQVYGGGGDEGAIYMNDFIELYNRGATAVPLAGWSVQYAPATSTSWQVTDLSGAIDGGAFYLVQEAQGAGGTMSLPTPQVTGTINLNATDGKVALVSNTTPPTVLSTACPSIGGSVVDLVAYGTTGCADGAPALSDASAAARGQNGCTDTEVNSADFGTQAPDPRNASSPANGCMCP